MLSGCFDLIGMYMCVFTILLLIDCRFQVLYLALKTLKDSGHGYVYHAVEKPLLLAQSAAVLEVCAL